MYPDVCYTCSLLIGLSTSPVCTKSLYARMVSSVAFPFQPDTDTRFFCKSLSNALCRSAQKQIYMTSMVKEAEVHRNYAGQSKVVAWRNIINRIDP